MAEYQCPISPTWKTSRSEPNFKLASKIRGLNFGFWILDFAILAKIWILQKIYQTTSTRVSGYRLQNPKQCMYSLIFPPTYRQFAGRRAPLNQIFQLLGPTSDFNQDRKIITNC